MRGGSEQCEAATAVMVHLASNPKSHAAVMAAGGAEALIEVMRGASGYTKVYALMAVRSLTANLESHAAIMAAGGIKVLYEVVEALIEMMGGGSKLCKAATAAMVHLAKSPKSHAAIKAAGKTEALNLEWTTCSSASDWYWDQEIVKNIVA
eukprot:4175323-Prymnesium_polylepis.1